MKTKSWWGRLKVQLVMAVFLAAAAVPGSAQAAERASVAENPAEYSLQAASAKSKKIGFQKTKSGKTYYVNSKGRRIRGFRRFGSNYFYFGPDTYLVKNKWINISGKRYRASENGKLRTGFWTSFRGNTYYFDKYCVQKQGWQKIKNAYYYFDLKTGLMAKRKTVDGIYLQKDGKAKVTAKNKKYVETFVTAQKIVEEQTNPSMTKTQKLRKCFDYVIAKPYITRRYPFRNYEGWEVDYANDTFLLGGGTCFSDGSSFAFLANALRYEEVYSCSSAAHGWTLINGRVYDPLLAEDKKSDFYYGGFRENQNGFKALYKVKIG